MISLFKAHFSQMDLHDYEVQAFVPLLMVKMGDPKSMVLDLCRSILHTITVLYPASKVWPHLCEATKTKNARQKAEALEQMAQLIETNTISVCGNLPVRYSPRSMRSNQHIFSDRCQADHHRHRRSRFEHAQCGVECHDNGAYAR